LWSSPYREQYMKMVTSILPRTIYPDQSNETIKLPPFLVKKIKVQLKTTKLQKLKPQKPKLKLNQ
jgi:hypothetical protein